jgi:putative membrane protein
MMDGWYHDMGAGGWALMAIFWVVLVVVVVWALTNLLGGKGQTSEPRERPEEILDRRLAAGEIDAQTYDELRTKLRASVEKKT